MINVFWLMNSLDKGTLKMNQVNQDPVNSITERRIAVDSICNLNYLGQSDRETDSWSPVFKSKCTENPLVALSSLQESETLVDRQKTSQVNFISYSNYNVSI